MTRYSDSGNDLNSDYRDTVTISSFDIDAYPRNFLNPVASGLAFGRLNFTDLVSVSVYDTKLSEPFIQQGVINRSEYFCDIIRWRERNAQKKSDLDSPIIGCCFHMSPFISGRDPLVGTLDRCKRFLQCPFGTHRGCTRTYGQQFSFSTLLHTISMQTERCPRH
jgi:hypothetical protein